MLDGSGSIDAASFLLMKNFASQLASSFNLDMSSGARIAVVQFSSFARVEFAFQDRLANIETAITKIKQISGGTAINQGLETAMTLLYSARPMTQKVLWN